MFFERLIKEKIIHHIDQETFATSIIHVAAPRIVVRRGYETRQDGDSKAIIYIADIYDDQTLIGQFKYGEKWYKGIKSLMQAFVKQPVMETTS